MSKITDLKVYEHLTSNWEAMAKALGTKGCTRPTYQEWCNSLEEIDVKSEQHFNAGRAPWNKGVKLSEKDRQSKSKAAKEYLSANPTARSGRKRPKQAIDNAAGTYKVTQPNGKQITVKNLSQYCRDNKLHAPCMFNVAAGRSKSHKGYLCVKT